MIEEKKSGGWVWFYNHAIENEQEAFDAIRGKYLFFSLDKQKLIDIAKEVLVKYELYLAKVPRGRLLDNNKDYVLCIYDSSDRYKYELSEYGDDVVIHYRYWKRR